MTVGQVLLWMDLLLACFVYVGLQTGLFDWISTNKILLQFDFIMTALAALW